VRLEKEETEEVKPKELRLTGLEFVIQGSKTGDKFNGRTFIDINVSCLN